MTPFEITRPGDYKRILSFHGNSRYYLLHVPPSYDGSRPFPVVFAIHGATSNPRLMERFSGLNDKADSADFIVAYPAGSGAVNNVLTWNGGECCGFAHKTQVDDVGFFRMLLEDLARGVHHDADRVYLAGMSNGAHMAYRLASEMTEPFAAIACVAGPTSIDAVHPSRPIPLLHIHGTHDEFAPFNGGRGPRSLYGIDMRSVPDTIAMWVKANGCPTEPKVEHFPDRVGDGTSIVRHTYGPCQEAAEVILYTVENGGHTWPGRPPLPLTLGKSTANLIANDVIWEFFQRHPRK